MMQNAILAFALAWSFAAGAQVAAAHAGPAAPTTFLVTAYGAYADGTHADETTAAFQAALTAAEGTAGGTVAFPGGTYSLRPGIRILTKAPRTLSVTIRGSNQDQTVLSFTGAGTALTIGTLDASPVFTTVNISDLEIRGNKSTTDGIRISNTGNITMDRVVVQEFINDGVVADSAQYVHISDSTFGANGKWGFDALPPRLNPGVQNNTILFTNTSFMSNGLGGYRLVAAREVTFIGCTMQDNGVYGGVDTGDLRDAVGGLPQGPPSEHIPSGAFSDNIRFLSSHYEINGKYGHYIEYATNITDIHPAFFGNKVKGGGDFFVRDFENIKLVKQIVLINPLFLGTKGPEITIPGGELDSIDTGNAQAVHIDYSRLGASLVRSGGSLYDVAAIGFQPGTYTLLGDTTDVKTGDTLMLARAGVALKSNAKAYGIDMYPQGSEFPFSLVGTATARRFVMFPDATGTVAYTSQLPLKGTSGSLGGVALPAGQCARVMVSVPGATTAMTAAVSAAGGVDPGDGFDVRATVMARDSVQVRVCALVAGTPVATTYNVRVLP